MSKTTICKRARRKIKQARELEGRLAGFLGKSDSIKQVPNIKNTRKQLAKILTEARELWFQKVVKYLEEYLPARVSRFGVSAKERFLRNISAPDKEGKIVYDGDLNFEDGITKLPTGLEVQGDLKLKGAKLTKLPARLTVKGTLDLRETGIVDLPDDLIVTENVMYADRNLEPKLAELHSKGQVNNVTLFNKK